MQYNHYSSRGPCREDNFILRTDSRFAPKQWKTSLQSIAVSHWLGTNLESVLKLAQGHISSHVYTCKYPSHVRISFNCIWIEHTYDMEKPNTCHKRPVTQRYDVFFIYVWINGWVNNREAGELRRRHAHYEVTVMNQLVNSELPHKRSVVGNAAFSCCDHWIYNVITLVWRQYHGHQNITTVGNQRFNIRIVFPCKVIPLANMRRIFYNKDHLPMRLHFYII